MEVVARSTFVRQTPRKLRLIARQISGLGIKEAEGILKNLNKRSAEPLLAVLKQGIGNAINNFKVSKDSLKIKHLEVGEGPRMKRVRFVSRGRVHRILKRTGHITMVLEEAKPSSVLPAKNIVSVSRPAKRAKEEVSKKSGSES